VKKKNKNSLFYILKIIFCFFLVTIFTPCSYAQVVREDVVSYNLDYYTRKVKTDKEEAVQADEKKEKMEAIKIKGGQNKERRKEKIKDVLADIVKDIHISGSIEEKYNDNLYLTHSNRTETCLTDLMLNLNYKPKRGLDSRLGHSTFNLDISGGPELSNDTSKTVFYSFGAFPKLTHTRGKYSIDGGYGVERLHTNLTSLANEETVLTTLANPAVTTQNNSELTVYYWQQSYNAALKADWNRIPMEFQYAHAETTYQELYSPSNTTTDDFTLTNFFNVTPKTQFLISYDYGKIKYPNKKSSDNTSTQYWAGVKGKLAPKTTGDIQLGYQVLNPQAEGHVDTLSGRAKVDYKLSNAITAGLGAKREIEKTAYVDETYVKVNEISLTLNYQPHFNRRLSFGSALTFNESEYETKRTDHLYECGLSSRYQWTKWCNLVFKYDVAVKDSDEEVYQYKNNILSLTLAMDF
jgi:hypothetical protein